MALLALLLFGGQAIHSFTATMMFGVVLVGTYTSIFIAAPILIYLGVGTGRDALSGGGGAGAERDEKVEEKAAAKIEAETSQPKEQASAGSGEPPRRSGKPRRRR